MIINLDELIGNCTCREHHMLSTSKIILREDAINDLPDILNEFHIGKHPMIVCDTNTYEAAGRLVQGLLPNSKLICLNPDKLHADEKSVAFVIERLPNDTDILLAVGSGTIHDITRYVANDRNLEFLSIPTAASVDGFVSSVAAMTWNGLKVTFTAKAPICVVADSSIFSKAPYRLTASGVSDLMGKYTALADWKIANLLTGEYFCEKVFNLELKALEIVTSRLMELRNGDIEAYEQLMYALLLSGLAMQMVGNSRPASGAEHHLSHLWEMAVINPVLNAYHGEKVSVGLSIVSEYYHGIKEKMKGRECYVTPYTGLQKEIIQYYFPKHLLEGIFLENQDDCLRYVEPYQLEEKMDEIASIIDMIPTPNRLKELLDMAGCVKMMEDIHLSDDLRSASLLLAPYVRNRLTLLRISKLFSR